MSSVTLHVRGRGDAALIFSRIQKELRTLEPGISIYGVRMVAQQIDDSLRRDRMMATLSGSSRPWRWC